MVLQLDKNENERESRVIENSSRDSTFAIGSVLSESMWDKVKYESWSVIKLSSLGLSTFRLFFDSKKQFLINWSRPISLKSQFRVSGTVDASRMARIIQKGSGKDVLESVKWKEFILTYVQCVVFSLFIVCKNALWSVKHYFDNRFGPTRRHIAHKFPALSLIRSGEKHTPNLHRSIACPQHLTDSQWGNHKYMKLKVRVWCEIFLYSSRTLNVTSSDPELLSVSWARGVATFSLLTLIINYVFT